MAGESFKLGEQKVRPGTYVRITNTGEPPIQDGAQGIAGAIIKANWGPLNEVVSLEASDEVSRKFGNGQGAEVLRELFRGGSREVKAIRVGKSGAEATVTLKDTVADTPADVVKLSTKYPTSRDFNVTVRDALGDDTMRELLVYEGAELLETVSFAKGEAEPDNVTDAVNANSQYLSATKEADGNGTLAAISNQELTGGSDPEVTGEDYTDAASVLETEEWNIVVTDTEDFAVLTALKTYVDRLRDEGKRVMGVFGEPTSVDFEERKSNSQSFNDPAVVYVGNGFESSAGIVEGARAAARAAGEVLRSNYTSSLTHHVLGDAVDVVGKLTNRQIEQAINAGMLVFTQNATGQVQFEYGITTFTTPTADLDAGWKKIRRVRTRDTLIDRVVRTIDPLIGQLNNSEDGRATVISVINGIINQMVAEGGLLGGQASLDESQQPVGDSAWFKVEVDDLDSLEKAYFTFGFRFAPEA